MVEGLLTGRTTSIFLLIAASLAFSVYSIAGLVQQASANHVPAHSSNSTGTNPGSSESPQSNKATKKGNGPLSGWTESVEHRSIAEGLGALWSVSIPVKAVGEKRRIRSRTKSNRRNIKGEIMPHK